MLYIFVSVLIIFPVLMGFGRLSQKIFGAFWEGLSAQLVLGILFLMTVWSVLSFFVPLNIDLERITVGCGFLLFFYFQSYKEFLKIDRKNCLLWGGFSLVFLVVGSGFPFILDHFGYYVPTIKWLSEYGLVKGIANLDWVLGQMSPWHIFQAGFSHFSDEFLRINVLLLMIFFLYIIEKKSWIMLCFSPVLFFFVQSPSPDLPAIVFSLIILNEILTKNKEFVLLFAFSVLVFSIKPTMLWLPILAFLYPILIFRKGLKFIWLGCLFGVLYCVKNIWTFGYPFFPIQFLDLGFSWKPYDGLFISSSEVAVLKTFDLQYSLEEISQFSAMEYFVNWLFLDGIKGVINVGLILVLLVFGIFSWKQKDKITGIIFLCILVKSIFVICFSAQYRFFIDVFFVFFVVVFREIFSKKWCLGIFSGLSVLMISILAFPQILQEKVPSFNLGFVMKNFEVKQVYKPLYYSLNKHDTFTVGNLEFNVPRDYVFGFDTVLPVLTPHQLEEFYKLGIFPQKIGETLDQGFVWKKLNFQEKKHLKSIIEKIKK